MNAVEPLSLGFIERGLAQPEIAAGWQAWRREGTFAGVPDILRRRFTLSAGYAEAGRSPPIIGVGPDSFVAKCFGSSWAQSVIFSEATPDPELEALASGGYHVALSGEANFDIVKVECRDEAGRWMQLLYERLIVPLPVGDRQLIGCLTAPLAPIKWLRGRDDPDLPACSSTGSHPRGYGRADGSSRFPLVGCGNSPDGPRSLFGPGASR